MSAFLGGGGGGGGISTITEGVTPTSGFTDGYALTSVGNLVEEAPIRTLLTANQSVNVNSATGSDSITLAQALAGSPFATLQHAWDSLSGTLDLAEFTLTINLVGAGPYTLLANSGWAGGEQVNIYGAGSTTTVINDLGFATVTYFALGPTINIDQVTLNDNGSGSDILSFALGQIFIGGGVGDMAFGPASFAQIAFANPATTFNIFGDVTLKAGTSGNFVNVSGQAFGVNFANSMTLVGTPTYTQAFAFSSEESIYEEHLTSFVGTATGPRFLIAGGYISSGANGNNAQHFPGNAEGWIYQGGIYNPISPVNVTVPTGAGTVTLTPIRTQNVLNPAGNLTSLTIELPAGAHSISVANYQTSVVNDSIFTIAGLVVATTDGSALVGFPTSLGPGQSFTASYDLYTDTWYAVAAAPTGRRLLALSEQFYVDPSTGSNSNSGTSGSPFATLQYAWDLLSTTLDLGAYSLTINLAANTTYTLVTNNVFIGGQTVSLQGAGSGTTTINDMALGTPHTPSMTATIYINDLRLKDTGAAPGGYPGTLYTQGYWIIVLDHVGGGVVLDTTANSGSSGLAPFDHTTIFLGNNITVVGDAVAFCVTDTICAIKNNFTTLTFTSNIFSLGLAVAFNFSMVDFTGITAVGSASGPKYLALDNSLIKGQSGAWPSGLSAGAIFTGSYSGNDEEPVFAPTNGSTVTMLAHKAILNPAAGLATLTIVLPSVTPANTLTTINYSSSASISATMAIAAVTWSTSDGSSIGPGFPTVLAAGQEFNPYYGVVTNTWYP